MARDALTDFFASKRALVDGAIGDFLPDPNRAPRTVHECMRYSTREGKRLRPIITLAVAEMLGCQTGRVLPTSVAIEFIHTHSLILDDLPCMDNDTYRRGRPTSHMVYGEAVALLAADALLNLAITLLASSHRLAGLKPEVALEIIEEAGQTVGTDGMIGGQAQDLALPNGTGDAKTLESVHFGKTAVLFRLSARVAALAANASREQLAQVSAYGAYLGLAFQIVDDVLDWANGSGNASRGKVRGPSYAGTFGVDGALVIARQATARALTALAGFGVEAEILRSLAQFNLSRTA